MENLEILYRESAEADHAWSKELRRLFRSQAGNARFDRRGTSTPKLAELHARFHTACESWLSAFRTAHKVAA